LIPLKSQYFWRNFAVLNLFALLGTGLLFLSQWSAISNNERSATLAMMREYTGVLASGLTLPARDRDTRGMASIVDRLVTKTPLRITVIDNSGQVLVDTSGNPDGMDNLLHRPEVQSAIEFGLGEARRYSQTMQANFTFVAAPLVGPDGLVGVARLARSETDINQQIAARRQQLLNWWLGVLVLQFVVSVYFCIRRAHMLELITSVSRAIALGEFESRIPEARAWGFKPIVDAINLMARNSANRLSVLTADRNRLATIFTGMVEGVIDVDQHQNIIHINEAAARLLEIRMEISIGKPLWQAVRHKKIIEALDEAIKTRSVITARIEYQRSRDQLHVDIYVASMSDDQGRQIGAVLVLHDVTELRNLERVRTDFVANASHELKTPITAIRGLSETVVDDENVDRETLMRFMERIHAQSIRLSYLVGDLMTISRLESDQGKDDFAVINFTDLVNRAVLAAEPAAQGKVQTLSADLGEERLDVYGDRQNLSQLVDNLIDNAIKYTPEKGRIQVRLRRRAGEAVLEVQDSGIGISPQYLERVFERFYRVDKARSQSLGGTGLGLSIVRNIAERHGGTVSVVSQLGAGSTFSFRVPLTSTADES
jgi:two-component system phosphate regulon sensor histidine kinase PhoR